MIAPALVLLSLIGAWELAVRLGGVDPLLLPAPTHVAESLWEDRGMLAPDLLVTGWEALAGLAAAIVGGAAIAVAMHLSPPVDRTLRPLVVGSQAVPIPVVAPLIVGGNSVVALASTRDPLTAVTFGEVLATSDLPGGVVNLLTGEPTDTLQTMADHMDVNAIVYAGDDAAAATKVKTLCAGNVKRGLIYRDTDYASDDAQSPYRILDAQEVKTTWHPVGT